MKKSKLYLVAIAITGLIASKNFSPTPMIYSCLRASMGFLLPHSLDALELYSSLI